MSCPNITSPEWKSLVSAIGVENAWREFFKYGEIPDASIYNVEEPSKNIKPGVQELFNSNFLIFAEAKNAEEVIVKLINNNVIEKKCS